MLDTSLSFDSKQWSDRIPLWCILGWAVSAPVSIAVSQVFIGLSFAAIMVKIIFKLPDIIPHLMREPVRNNCPKNPIATILLPGGKSTIILLIAIAIWLLSQIPSLLISPEPALSWQGFGSSEWLIILCLAVLWSGANDKWIVRWILGLGVVSSVVALYTLWQHSNGWNDVTGQSLTQMGMFFRAEGFFSSCLTLAGFQLAVLGLVGTVAFHLPPCYCRGEKKGGLPSTSRFLINSEWFWGLILVLVGLSLVTTYARGAWVAAIVILILLIVNKKGWKYRWVWLVATILLVVGVLLLLPEALGRLESVFQIKGSGRLALWQGAIEMWRNHPWTGIGIGRFQEVFPKVFSGSGFVDSYCHAHSDPLNRLAETGIIGILGALVLWGVIAWMGWRIWRTNNPNLRVILGQAGAVGLLALWIAGWSQCYYTDAEVGAVWWFMVGLIGIAKQETEQSQVLSGVHT